MNKNLSEFENKLPSVLEYDTQQLLDYYYESPEKMKIAEVFFEFLYFKSFGHNLIMKKRIFQCRWKPQNKVCNISN